MKACLIFFEGCHHPGGSFINWAHVTSLTCKVNVRSTKTSHSLIDKSQITRGRVDFNRDSAAKWLCLRRLFNLRWVTVKLTVSYSPKFSSVFSLLYTAKRIEIFSKVMMVDETVYDDGIECHHSYDKRCHTTYTTDYEPQQVWGSMSTCSIPTYCIAIGDGQSCIKWCSIKL